MRSSFLIAIPSAVILVLASNVSAAQDKPGATVSKPVTTLTKPRKAASTSATAQQAAPVKATTQAVGKEVSPTTTRESTPIGERSFDGCHHGQESDA